MGMEHGCKSNETMKAAVYCDPRILIIRLTCRREREFNFSSNQLSVVNYYSHLPVFPVKMGYLSILIPISTISLPELPCFRDSVIFIRSARSGVRPIDGDITGIDNAIRESSNDQ